MNSIFNTQRTVVRRFTLQDSDDLFQWMSDPQVARYNYWSPHTRQETEAKIARLVAAPLDQVGRWHEFAVVLKENGRVIGGVNARLEDNTSRQCEVGYQFSTAYLGSGLATEAVAGLLSYLFQRWNVHRVFANADVRNDRSIKLMERLGMRREALHLENVWNKGEWNDEVIYAILRREWHERGNRGDSLPQVG